MVSKYWYFGFALAQIPIAAFLAWGVGELFSLIPFGLTVFIVVCYLKDSERGSVY